jgi:hypothetical protein
MDRLQRGAPGDRGAAACLPAIRLQLAGLAERGHDDSRVLQPTVGDARRSGVASATLEGCVGTDVKRR